MVTPLMPKEALPVVAVTAHLLCNRLRMAFIRYLLPVPATLIKIRKRGSMLADMSSECTFTSLYVRVCISLKLLRSAF